MISWPVCLPVSWVQDKMIKGEEARRRTVFPNTWYLIKRTSTKTYAKLGNLLLHDHRRSHTFFLNKEIIWDTLMDAKIHTS